MPQKSYHDFQEKYPYVHVGTLEHMHIRDTLPVFKNKSKTHNDIKLGKEVKTIMVVDTSLHSLRSEPRGGYYSAFGQALFWKHC